MLKSACHRCLQGSRSEVVPAESAPEVAALLSCSECLELELLPPPPIPNYLAKRQEALLGCITVSTIVTLFVGATNAVVFAVKEMPPVARWVLIILIWTEAAVGLICLAGILLSDPGVIPRGPSHSLPLPPGVTIMQGMFGLEMRMHYTQNYVADDGRSYCLRCCVWRPPDSHHCSTCGVCVSNFDHHCGIFGRCIAGSWLQGNMKYYRGILVSFLVGGVTCITSVVWGLSLALGRYVLIPIFLFLLALAWAFWVVVDNPFLLTDLAFRWRAFLTSMQSTRDSSEHKQLLLATDFAW